MFSQLLLTDHEWIYISTDYVFDRAKGNYTEDDETNPINYYGETKLEGEKVVQDQYVSTTLNIYLVKQIEAVIKKK